MGKDYPGSGDHIPLYTLHGALRHGSVKFGQDIEGDHLQRGGQARKLGTAIDEYIADLQQQVSKLPGRLCRQLPHYLLLPADNHYLFLHGGMGACEEP